MDHIPDHDEIESNEEPQNSPAVRHQRPDGVRLLLLLGEDGWIVKLYKELGGVWKRHLQWIANNLEKLFKSSCEAEIPFCIVCSTLYSMNSHGL